MISDALPARAYRRRTAPGRRRRTVALAAAAAAGGLLLAGGVAYGGSASSPHRMVVRPGDTLWAIAVAQYPGSDVRVRVSQIEAANHLGGAGLSPGQILTLPAP